MINMKEMNVMDLSLSRKFFCFILLSYFPFLSYLSKTIKNLRIKKHDNLKSANLLQLYTPTQQKNNSLPKHIIKVGSEKI